MVRTLGLAGGLGCGVTQKGFLMEDKSLADVQEENPAFPWAPPATVGMIGGFGEMGRLFSRLFEDLGYTVIVSDPRRGEVSNEELVQRSDIVVFAVPLHQTVSIIGSLAPLVRENQLLMDFTSLKVLPVKEMLHTRASVVGLHPMFGGRVPSFEGQTLVACPVRIESEWWQALRAMFESRGLRVKETSPEDHDRLMSIIQVLFHMTTMLTGRVLRELGVSISETLEYTSPSYRLEISLLGRIFAQNSALYSAITQMNPHTGEIIDQLRKGLDLYRGWFEEGRLDAFMEDFQKSAEHLGDFCSEAYRESSEILNFSVNLARERREEESTDSQE